MTINSGYRYDLLKFDLLRRCVRAHLLVRLYGRLVSVYCEMDITQARSSLIAGSIPAIRSTDCKGYGSTSDGQEIGSIPLFAAIFLSLQLSRLEHLTHTQQVVGSIPTRDTTRIYKRLYPQACSLQLRVRFPCPRLTTLGSLHCLFRPTFAAMMSQCRFCSYRTTASSCAFHAQNSGSIPDSCTKYK